MTEVLAAWNNCAARQAVVDFVEQTVSDGVPAEERVAVFDNDGTLWCEKPMPTQGCGTVSPGRRRTSATMAGSGR
ncbi:MAG TPA: hypothetical protein VMI73_14285 [Trebonia sp.]|nr:hypothetical protein [Trebonia sp.]